MIFSSSGGRCRACPAATSAAVDLLAPIAAGFDDGGLPLPPEPDCRPLREGRSAYAEINSGRSAKLVLLDD